MIMICFDLVHTEAGPGGAQIHWIRNTIRNWCIIHTHIAIDSKIGRNLYFFLLLSYVLIAMTGASELPLVCMRHLAMPILAVIESSFLVHPTKKSTKRKMLCVRCRYHCRDRRRCHHGRCHRTQNDHSSNGAYSFVWRVSLHLVFFISLLPISKNFGSRNWLRCLVVLRCLDCGLEKNIFWIW